MSENKVHFAKTGTSGKTYQVFFGEELILQSNMAVELYEHYAGRDFDAVVYFPQSAVSALGMTKTDHSTHCPIKGDASYWSYRGVENGIWSYEYPLAQLSQIGKHYAFDQSKGFRISVRD